MPTQAVVLHRWTDIRPEAVAPSIERKFLSGERVTIAQFELKRGGIVPRHAHESEQFSSVIRGALKFAIGGQEVVVRQGEVLSIPGWVEHEVEVLEDTLVLDVFSPIRQDWIDKTDHYFRR